MPITGINNYSTTTMGTALTATTTAKKPRGRPRKNKLPEQELISPLPPPRFLPTLLSPHLEQQHLSLPSPSCDALVPSKRMTCPVNEMRVVQAFVKYGLKRGRKESIKWIFSGFQPFSERMDAARVLAKINAYPNLHRVLNNTVAFELHTSDYQNDNQPFESDMCFKYDHTLHLRAQVSVLFELEQDYDPTREDSCLERDVSSIEIVGGKRMRVQEDNIVIEINPTGNLFLSTTGNWEVKELRTVAVAVGVWLLDAPEAALEASLKFEKYLVEQSSFSALIDISVYGDNWSEMWETLCKSFPPLPPKPMNDDHVVKKKQRIASTAASVSAPSPVLSESAHGADSHGRLFINLRHPVRGSFKLYNTLVSQGFQAGTSQFVDILREELLPRIESVLHISTSDQALKARLAQLRSSPIVPLRGTARTVFEPRSPAEVARLQAEAAAAAAAAAAALNRAVGDADGGGERSCRKNRRSSSSNNNNHHNSSSSSSSSDNIYERPYFNLKGEGKLSFAAIVGEEEEYPSEERASPMDEAEYLSSFPRATLSQPTASSSSSSSTNNIETRPLPLMRSLAVGVVAAGGGTIHYHDKHIQSAEAGSRAGVQAALNACMDHEFALLFGGDDMSNDRCMEIFGEQGSSSSSWSKPSPLILSGHKRQWIEGEWDENHSGSVSAASTPTGCGMAKLRRRDPILAFDAMMRKAGVADDAVSSTRTTAAAAAVATATTTSGVSTASESDDNWWNVK